MDMVVFCVAAILELYYNEVPLDKFVDFILDILPSY